jgi:hypothetical protein
MSSNDPVAEWRQRWQSNSYAPVLRQPQPPRSPWVYALAAFGGTVAALVCLGVSCVGILFAIGMSIDEYVVPERTIGYRNDTDEPLSVYACVDRCDDILWSHYLEPDDWAYFSPELYEDDPVDWLLVTHEDDSYECIELVAADGGMIELSAAAPCPSDIHSPDNDVM